MMTGVAVCRFRVDVGLFVAHIIKNNYARAARYPLSMRLPPHSPLTASLVAPSRRSRPVT